MAYSWRPPPPQPHPSQGESCPVCYYPHFPFCHPPPPYPPNPIPQYQPHPGHLYHRHPPLAPPQLGFDPFLDHHSAPPMHPHHRPYMDRYEALPLPLNQGVNFNSNPYGSLNPKDNFVQGNAGSKRKHYDDSSESCAKSARFSVDDERRLKLIHDHGGPTDHDPGSRRDREKIEDHGKGRIEFPDFGHGDRNQRQYELQLVDINMRQRNGNGFNGGPAYNYKKLDPWHNTMQHEQSASLGFTLENSSDGSLSDFYPKKNQFGSRRQAAVSENTPLHDSPPPLLAGIPVSSSPPRTTPSLFPIHAGASVSMPNYLPGTDAAQAYYHAIGNSKPPAGFAIENFHYASPRIGPGESEQYPARHLSSEKPNIIDAIHILKHPHRSARPAHIVVILRGLPGSGKSYLAKMLRDLEVENGGNAPRIHSIDDYFMTEVEKVEESEVSRSAGSTKGKKSRRKKVIEYCYEPEMEEAYRSSMLKAFKKTLDEGVFSLVIVDDRNLRVADFAQFWATAKRSGYEVYLLEAPYKDPVGCAARNVHGFTLSEIQKWTDEWEEAPSMYLKLDIKSLIHRDDLEHGAIQEVDMDMEDGDASAGPSTSEQGINEIAAVPPTEMCSDGHSKSGLSWDDEESEHPISLVKDIGKSKWSTDLDEDDVQKYENTCKKSNGSGLIQSSRKEGKTVRWGDQAAKAGFSIGAKKAANVSLVIGPGAGYNLKSNPIAEGEENMPSSDGWQTKRRQGVFQEQLRAEQESFKAVLDKRRQRLVGFVADDE